MGRHTNARLGGTWVASQQIQEPRNALTPDDFRDATLRQMVYLTIGGKMLRVHLSIPFGTIPLPFESVHIARALSTASARINLSTDRGRTSSHPGTPPNRSGFFP